MLSRSWKRRIFRPKNGGNIREAKARKRSDDISRFETLAPVILSIVAAIVTGIWGLYKYLEENRIQSNKNLALRTFEAQKPFLEKQLSLYVDASQIAGKIITSDPSKADWKELRRRLEELTTTEMTIVEDGAVEVQFLDFSAEVDSYDYFFTQLGADKVVQKDKEKLVASSRELARQMRKSLEIEWRQQGVPPHPNWWGD